MTALAAHAAIIELVGELRAAGYDLWSYDEDGEGGETWGPDYVTAQEAGVIVTFGADGDVRVNWARGR